MHRWGIADHRKAIYSKSFMFQVCILFPPRMATFPTMFMFHGVISNDVVVDAIEKFKSRNVFYGGSLGSCLLGIK
jgi:hypothetical protein